MTGNPFLRRSGFDGYGYAYAPVGERMTLVGTANKVIILLLLVMATAFGTAYLFFYTHLAALVMLLMILGMIGGFIVALITIFKQNLAPVTAPLYAVFEGLAVGGISAIFEVMFPGIVFQAVSMTFIVLLIMAFLYRSRIIKVTRGFRIAIISAIGAIMVVYIAEIILSFMGMGIPYIFGNGPIGIGFSLLVVGVASFSLMLDFDMIERGAQSGAPAYMEWYGAFALLVTLVWLYIEMLRLLAKMRR